LGSIACPTLIIAGRLDVGTPVSMAQAMAERIPGSQLVVLDDAAHLSALEQPARFAQHLQAFLTRVG
jgi:3-oxoadipate enol-lactonase